MGTRVRIQHPAKRRSEFFARKFLQKVWHRFFKICRLNSVIEQSAIYWSQTVAIFPLSEKIVNSKLVRQALMSSSTSFRCTGEVDKSVAVKAQEGEGRDERRK